MKLIVIGCILASAYLAESESLNSGQYFQRTPNNNLVQITHVSAHGGGVYGNRQDANSQRYGYNNQFNSQLSNQGSQVSYNNRNQLFNNPLSYSQNQRYGSFNQNSNSQRSQNQLTSQNQRYQTQFYSQNQHNQIFNQVNQQNQRFNQQNQISQNQFNQQNQRTNRQQPFLPNPNRQGQEFQDQEIQQGQRTEDGRFLLLCPASVAADYIACQLRCRALSFSLESKCLLEAWANRNKACWNLNPSMICPA